MTRSPRHRTSREGTPVDAWVGARIAGRRQGLGLSQTALAERVGVSFQQIQKYETGINRISASRLYQIALALGAEPGSFFPARDPSSTQGERPAASWPPAGSPAARLAEVVSRIPRRKARQALLVLAECLAEPPGAHP
ncbi:helix-turn-helix domain-containing protein [Brevundimonas sp.]|uniref:helix-turn-helix domain-containing protein n=1 Tax=Brevundimonas sp. TaxID=1871086 RepID=UPI003AF94E65